MRMLLMTFLLFMSFVNSAFAYMVTRGDTTVEVLGIESVANVLVKTTAQNVLVDGTCYILPGREVAILDKISEERYLASYVFGKIIPSDEVEDRYLLEECVADTEFLLSKDAVIQLRAYEIHKKMYLHSPQGDVYEDDVVVSSVTIPDMKIKSGERARRTIRNKRRHLLRRVKKRKARRVIRSKKKRIVRRVKKRKVRRVVRNKKRRVVKRIKRRRVHRTVRNKRVVTRKVLKWKVVFFKGYGRQ